jgi:hypothetical protein
MTKNHFNAILAKNEIAKMIVDGKNTGELGMVAVNTRLLHFYLREIERYTGEGNQPSVLSIINNE